MKIAMRKSGGVLAADNQQAIDCLAKIPEGKLVMADVRQSRNVLNHRRFFAFIDSVYSMQEHFTEKESLRKWLIMKAGYFKTINAPNGYTIFEAESMDFSSMDEIKFQELFSACIDVAVRELALDQLQLNRVIEFA